MSALPAENRLGISAGDATEFTLVTASACTEMFTSVNSAAQSSGDIQNGKEISQIRSNK